MPAAFDVRARNTAGTAGPTACRRGYTLLELFVSFLLFGAILGILVPLARRAADQQRLAERRRVAVLEVSNVLERMTAAAASAPATGEERSVPLPAEFPRLRDPKLTVRAVAVAGDVPGRRLDATLAWAEPNGGTAEVRLSAFLFGEGRP